MNALKLHHDLKKRGVNLVADGENLKVDAPAGALTDEDRAALLEGKPVLLEFLSRETSPEGVGSDAADVPKSKARWAGLEWIRIFDPIEEAWHEVPSSMCLPGVIAEANTHRKRNRGGVA